MSITLRVKEVTHSTLCLICLFFTKGPIAIFSSPTEGEQEDSSFLHCKDLLDSSGHKPFLHVVSDFRCEQHWLFCRAVPKQSPPVSNNPSACAAAQPQLSLLLLAIVFPTAVPNSLPHHHLPLPPNSPFQPTRKGYKTQACVFSLVPEP